MSFKTYAKVLILGIFIITAIFVFVYMKDIVLFLKSNKNTEEVANFKYLELRERNFSYIYNDTIYTLYKNKFIGYDFEGKIKHQRVLDSDNYILKGINDKIFLYDNEKSKLIILSSENVLLKEFDYIYAIDGIKSLGDDYVLLYQDGYNYKTMILNDRLENIFDVGSNSSSVDVNKINRDTYNFLYLSSTDNGLKTIISKISDDKSEEVEFELSGYIPYKFYVDGNKVVIATDLGLVFLNKYKVANKFDYENFGGFYRLDDSYVLYADGKIVYFDISGNIKNEEEIDGLENLVKINDDLLVLYGGRDFYKLDKNGIKSHTQTDRDIFNIYGNKNIVVEFKNGFMIYY